MDTMTVKAVNGASPSSPGTERGSARLVLPPVDFKLEHFLDKGKLQIVNAKLHKTAEEFFGLDIENIIHLCTKRNPEVNEATLRECLSYRPKHFHWAGSDLFTVRDSHGRKKMLVLEMNTRAVALRMPVLPGRDRNSHYLQILNLLLRLSKESEHQIEGDIAIVYDSSIKAEPFAHLATMIPEFQENCNVWYVHCPVDEQDPDCIRWDDGVMYVHGGPEGHWQPIRACLRYLGERPWLRLPLKTKTVVLNDIIADLAGGRNKSLAAIAYADYNEELRGSGLEILFPKTKSNVPKAGLRRAVDELGGIAVIKTPYGHSGQEIYMIETPDNMERVFTDHHFYDNFIVQPIIAPECFWASSGAGRNKSKLTLLGTKPDSKGRVYTFDLRFIVLGTEKGLRPLLACGRTSKVPHQRRENGFIHSTPLWDMLGTNLSVLKDEHNYATDQSRVLILDEEGFERMQLSMDDLVDAYIKTVLCTIAIDKMCLRLLPEHGHFNMQLFEKLNRDEKLMSEISPVHLITFSTTEFVSSTTLQ